MDSLCFTHSTQHLSTIIMKNKTDHTHTHTHTHSYAHTHMNAQYTHTHTHMHFSTSCSIHPPSHISNSQCVNTPWPSQAYIHTCNCTVVYMYVHTLPCWKKHVLKAQVNWENKNVMKTFGDTDRNMFPPASWNKREMVHLGDQRAVSFQQMAWGNWKNTDRRFSYLHFGIFSFSVFMRGPKDVSWFTLYRDRKNGTDGVTHQSDCMPGLPVCTETLMPSKQKQKEAV